MAGTRETPVLLLAGFPEDVVSGIAARLPELTVRSATTVSEATQSATGATVVAVDELLAGDDTDALLAQLGRSRADLRLVCALRERPPLARMLKLAGELHVAKILYHPLDREELAHTVAELTGAALLPAERADDESADLAQIWSEHLPDVLARVTVIENAIVALLEGHLSAQVTDEARREAHTLGGSVALFGFSRASSLAREIETAFRSTAARQDAPRLAQLAVDLRDELAGTVSPPSAPSGVGDAVVLLLTDDPELGPKLSAALTDRGLRLLRVLRDFLVHQDVPDLNATAGCEVSEHSRSRHRSHARPPVGRRTGTGSRCRRRTHSGQRGNRTPTVKDG